MKLHVEQNIDNVNILTRAHVFSRFFSPLFVLFLWNPR